MARVLTFSTTFPKYHPRAGQKTDFVKKIWSDVHLDFLVLSMLVPDTEFFINEISEFEKCKLITKGHTVRKGHRFKKDDWFSPRVWSGVPYNSPQKIFYSDIKVLNVYDFKISAEGVCSINGKPLNDKMYKILAMNDGLSSSDFYYWFSPYTYANKPFDGQIICWDNNIKNEYDKIFNSDLQ